jgi:hypothetical protein
MEKAPLLLPQNPIHNQKVSHCVVVIKNFKNKEKEIHLEASNGQWEGQYLLLYPNVYRSWFKI